MRSYILQNNIARCSPSLSGNIVARECAIVNEQHHLSGCPPAVPTGACSRCSGREADILPKEELY